MLKLKELRNERNLTQVALAQFLNISRGAYANIENGKRDPDTVTIVMLADYYGISIDALFGRETPENGLSTAESELISIFRSLNRSGKEWLLENARVGQQTPKFAKANSNRAAG